MSSEEVKVEKDHSNLWKYNVQLRCRKCNASVEAPVVGGEVDWPANCPYCYTQAEKFPK